MTAIRMDVSAAAEGLSRAERRRCVKAEVWIRCAALVQQAVDDDHGWVSELVEKYGLPDGQVERAVTAVAQAMETRAVNSGYEMVPDIGEWELTL